MIKYLALTIAISLLISGRVTSEESTTLANSQTVTNPSDYLQEKDEYSVEVASEERRPEITLNSEAGLNIPQSQDKHHHQIFSNNIDNRYIPIDLFHKFSPANVIKPITDKLSKIAEFFTYSLHPNYGGVQFLSPQDLWEKIHEKGHHFLTGSSGAIFGVGHLDNHDYPFAYRNSKSLSNKKINFLMELLNKYNDNKTQPFKYNVNYVTVNNTNDSYAFPYMLSKMAAKDLFQNISKMLHS